MKTARSCLCASEWIRCAIEQGRSQERHFQMRLTYACEWIKGDKQKESILSASGLALCVCAERWCHKAFGSSQAVQICVERFQGNSDACLSTAGKVSYSLGRRKDPRKSVFFFSNKRRKGGFVCFCVWEDAIDQRVHKKSRLTACFYSK